MLYVHKRSDLPSVGTAWVKPRFMTATVTIPVFASVRPHSRCHMLPCTLSGIVAVGLKTVRHHEGARCNGYREFDTRDDIVLMHGLSMGKNDASTSAPNIVVWFAFASVPRHSGEYRRMACD